MSKYNFELIKNEGTPIMCIFGCLLSEAGKKIKKEMLEWITYKYDCICVNQEYPGTLYEWPALKFAQKYSIDNNIPVLYVHTKGAFNSKNVYLQNKVRELWKDEFINNYNFYEKAILENKKTVAGPFIADVPFGVTWLNGFMAAPDAWKTVDISVPRKSRYEYEFLFKGKDIKPISRVLSGVNQNGHFNENKKFRMMTKYINSL